MKVALSSAEYIQKGGTICPYCQSDQIEGASGVEIESGEAWQKVRCLSCGGYWEDVYRLMGYRSGAHGRGCDDPGQEAKTGGLYLIFGDIEPEVIGPFTDEDGRDRKALAIRKQRGDEEGIFRLNVEDRIPSILTYSAGFFDRDNGEGR